MGGDRFYFVHVRTLLRISEISCFKGKVLQGLVKIWCFLVVVLLRSTYIMSLCKPSPKTTHFVS